MFVQGEISGVYILIVGLETIDVHFEQVITVYLGFLFSGND